MNPDQEQSDLGPCCMLEKGQSDLGPYCLLAV